MTLQRRPIRSTDDQVPTSAWLHSGSPSQRLIRQRLTRCALSLFCLVSLFCLLWVMSAVPAHADPRGSEPQSTYLYLEGGNYNPVEMMAERETEEALAEDILELQLQLLDSISEEARAGVRYLFSRQYSVWGEWTDEQLEELSGSPYIGQITAVPQTVMYDAEAHALTSVDEMHDLGFTGKDIVIAILDSAIEHDHAAFGGETSFPNSKIIGGYDLADNDADPTADPGCNSTNHAHGTSVAGVAAGNGGGVVGVAPDAKIVFYKLDQASSCNDPFLVPSGPAIDLAVAERLTYGTKIISMSLGVAAWASNSPCNSNTVEKQAVDAALAAEMIVIAASGNDLFCDKVAYPACISGVISVGAVSDSSNVSLNTGTCPNTPGCICVSSNHCLANALPHQPNNSCTGTQVAVDISNFQPDKVSFYSNTAPILDVLAPSECATTAGVGGTITNCFNGTSSATPYVAGLAAAALEALGGPDSVDGYEMRDLLWNSGMERYDWRIYPVGIYPESIKRRVHGEMAVKTPCLDCTGWSEEYYIPGTSKYFPPYDNFFPFAGGEFQATSGPIEGWLRQHELPAWQQPSFTMTLQRRMTVFLPWPPYTQTQLWMPVASGKSYVSYAGAAGTTYRWKVDGISSNSNLKYTLWSRH